MSLGKSRLLVSFLYILLLGTAVYLSIFLPEPHLMIKLLIIDIILTILVFFQSLILKNASMYDLYWSVFPFFFLFYWIYELQVETLNYRMIICCVLLSVWSWRLSLNWFRGWKGLSHEDWRYRNLRNKTGFFYPVVNFLGIHLFPTILVFIASMPLEIILSSQNEFNYIDAIGAVLMATGILLELFADDQMHKFKKDDKNKGKFINIGVWRFSRHPNYLGEILFWWGLYIFSIAAGAPYFLIVGPILMSFLFIVISIPMMEKRLSENYENYDEYKRKTSILIPTRFI